MESSSTLLQAIKVRLKKLHAVWFYLYASSYRHKHRARGRPALSGHEGLRGANYTGAEIAFQSDRNAFHLDCIRGYMALCIPQNSEVYTKKFEFNVQTWYLNKSFWRRHSLLLDSTLLSHMDAKWHTSSFTTVPCYQQVNLSMHLQGTLPPGLWWASLPKVKQKRKESGMNYRVHSKLISNVNSKLFLPQLSPPHTHTPWITAALTFSLIRRW